MFYNQCGRCGERWEIGTARTCKCEATPVQEPVEMREVLVKIARFLDVVRVYAQDIQPKNELETDKPLHWKARELQDEVIRLLDTTPPAQPAAVQDWKDRLIAQHEETILWQAKRIAELTDQQPAQPAALSLEDSLKVTKVCCGDYANCHAPCTPRGRWQAQPAAWVGLTDEEIDKAWRDADCTKPWDFHRIDVSRAIEAKLREKNGSAA